MRGFALAAAIAFGMLCLTAQTDQIEKTQPDDFAHAEWLATGGQAWKRIAGLVLSGTRTEGGVPGKFEKIIDLRTGYSRTVFETGPMRTMEGYDGVAWQAGNGIVNSVDLPPLVADARSEAFVDRAGWRSDEGQPSSRSEHKDQVDVVHYNPPGGSGVQVSYDHNSHLVTQVTIETDDGPLSVTYSDWRSIGKVKIPFRQVQKDNTGEVTILDINQARLLEKIDAVALARPQRTPHGQLASSDQAKRTVPFIYVGSTYILVPARINDMEANLIFDTGAANYFSPSSAQRFGLEVAGGLNLSGVGESSTTGGYAKARKISIGAAELKDEVAVVAPTPFGGRPGEQGVPDGFAGFEFLSEFRTTIDYPAHTISFSAFEEKADVDGVKVPFYSDGHSIYVEAEVDNERGLFRLDTGDGGTVTLFPNFAKRHNLYQNEGESVVGGGGVGGKVAARRVTVSRFNLAGENFSNLPGRLSQNAAGAFASQSLAGNLGGGILRCFRISFDYPARLLVFKSPSQSASGCNFYPQR